MTSTTCCGAVGVAATPTPTTTPKSPAPRGQSIRAPDSSRDTNSNSSPHDHEPVSHNANLHHRWAAAKLQRHCQPIPICCLLETNKQQYPGAGPASDLDAGPRLISAETGLRTSKGASKTSCHDDKCPCRHPPQPLAHHTNANHSTRPPASTPRLLKKETTSCASKRSPSHHKTMSPSSNAGSPPFSGPSILSAALASPNAIPPRTSSTGNGTLGHIPPKSVLRPVPESDWLSQNQKVSHRPAIASSNLQTTSFTVTMKPPPPPDPNRYATQDLNVTSTRPWPEEKERVVAGPYDYLIAQPGKDFRSQVINAFNAWLDVPHESLVVINKVVGMLHTASLLIDDVEDSSSLRRGLPVAHNIFGVPQTINSANYIYFCALQELQKLNNPDTINIFTEELVNLHRGQGMDLYWRDTLTCPTEDDYLEMVGNKTGGLFRLGIKLMQAESRRHVDCVPLVNVFGLVFQIRDDYMNLNSKEYSNNKGMCEDLTEGKFSFPVIHSIRTDPGNLQLINILGQKTSDVEVKRYAVSFMERTGSFEYTRQVIDVLIARARKLVSEIDESGTFGAGIQVILDKMCV